MGNKNYHKAAWYPIIAVSLSMVSFIMIRSARDAVFFQKDGIFQLPIAYIWISITAIPAAMIHLHVIDRFGARTTRILVYVSSSLIFFFFVPFVEMEHRTLMTIFFILVPTIFAALFAGAWLLASDLLEGADHSTLRWAYSRIGAGSMVGGIIGGTLSRGLAPFLETKFLVLGGVILLTIVAAIINIAHKNNPIDKRLLFESSSSGNDKINPSPETEPLFKLLIRRWQVFKLPYVITLIGIGGLTAIAGLFIDFQFYATTMITNNNNIEFFASFYIILNTISLFLQIFLAPRLQSKLGIAGALMILPSSLLGISGVFSFWVIAHSKSILKVAEGGLKSSIHRSIWEQVYLPINRANRAGVKTIVDGMFSRLSEGMGALVLYFWLISIPRNLDNLELRWIAWIIALIILFWIALTQYLKKLGCNQIQSSEIRIRLPDG
jgi:hypothetical protein